MNILITWVAITQYSEPYIGEPLFCSTWDTPLFYDATTPPWAALPDSFWQNGGECWDKIGIMINGQIYVHYALDRMQYGDWYVRQPDGVLLPIAADIPQPHAPFPGLSTVGRVWNLRLTMEERNDDRVGPRVRNLEPILREWGRYR